MQKTGRVINGIRFQKKRRMHQITGRENGPRVELSQLSTADPYKPPQNFYFKVLLAHKCVGQKSRCT